MHTHTHIYIYIYFNEDIHFAPTCTCTLLYGQLHLFPRPLLSYTTYFNIQNL